MKYTQYIKTASVISLLSVVNLAFAATAATVSTGDTTTVTGTTAATGAIATTTAPLSLEVKGAPRLVKKTSDSVSLEWDKVPAASAYIVKYSKSSVANSKDPNAQYDNETDQVSGTGVVISKLSTSSEKLSPATAYYFSVVAIDKEGKESDTFSDELMVMTEATASGATATGIASTPTASLAIKDLTVVDDSNISLSFNSDLSNDTVKVKITKTSDNSDVVVGTVTKDEKMANTVNISMVSKLSPSSAYTLTVLSAKDASGNIIQEGVSGLKEFKTLATLKASALTATGAIDTTSSGAALIVPTTTVETGAKENIIILAALLLSLGIVVIYRRKLV